MSKFIYYMFIDHANWYEFWRPSSGIKGGAVGGVILFAVITLAA